MGQVATKPKTSECSEKSRLESDLAAATEALEFLHSGVNVMNLKEYDMVSGSINRATEIVEQTKAALEAHTAEHDC